MGPLHFPQTNQTPGPNCNSAELLSARNHTRVDRVARHDEQGWGMEYLFARANTATRLAVQILAKRYAGSSYAVYGLTQRQMSAIPDSVGW